MIGSVSNFISTAVPAANAVAEGANQIVTVGQEAIEAALQLGQLPDITLLTDKEFFQFLDRLEEAFPLVNNAIESEMGLKAAEFFAEIQSVVGSQVKTWSLEQWIRYFEDVQNHSEHVLHARLNQWLEMGRLAEGDTASETIPMLAEIFVKIQQFDIQEYKNYFLDVYNQAVSSLTLVEQLWVEEPLKRIF